MVKRWSVKNHLSYFKDPLNKGTYPLSSVKNPLIKGMFVKDPSNSFNINGTFFAWKLLNIYFTNCNNGLTLLLALDQDLKWDPNSEEKMKVFLLKFRND